MPETKQFRSFVFIKDIKKNTPSILRVNTEKLGRGFAKLFDNFDITIV